MDKLSGSYTMDTDELPQVKTENDPKPPKVKAVEELTQADDENSSNAPTQQTGRKRKRKRGGGEKGKKKKSKNAKPVTLRRNIRYSHFVCLRIHVVRTLVIPTPVQYDHFI